MESKIHQPINESTRVHWIDTVKAFGIILMVYAHTYPGDDKSKIFWYIFAFHMPLFLFLSGYLYDKTKFNTFGSFFGRRVKTLLRPYLIFAIITYVITVVLWFLYVKWGWMQEYKIDILQFIKSILIGNGNSLFFNVALWFIPCLFVTEIMFYIIAKLLEKDSLIIVVLFISSLIGFAIGKYIHFRFYWSIDVAFTGVVFYGVGYLIRKHNVLTWIKKRALFTLPALFIISVIFSLLNPGRADLNNVKYYNYFYFYIAAFSAILAWITIAMVIKQYKLLTYLGKNTILVLAFNFPFFSIISAFIGRWYCPTFKVPYPQNTIWLKLFNTIVMLAMALLVALVRDKLKHRNTAKISTTGHSV